MWILLGELVAEIALPLPFATAVSFVLLLHLLVKQVEGCGAGSFMLPDAVVIGLGHSTEIGCRRCSALIMCSVTVVPDVHMATVLPRLSPTGYAGVNGVRDAGGDDKKHNGYEHEVFLSV
jgi:hypothetical protein